jgi:DNA-binding IclR family transcriptional regulator
MKSEKRPFVSDSAAADERVRRDGTAETSSTLKAFAVLEALVKARVPVSLAELMLMTGLPKPSLHRTLGLFEEAGWVAREPNGRAYAVGRRLSSFALEVLKNDHLAAVRRAVLRQLVEQLGETCNLAVLRRGEVVYLDRVEAEWPLRLHLDVGTTLSPHCCASGKLLVAFLPDAERRQLLDSLPLMRFTDRTITDPQLLALEMDRVRANGYAVDNEEYVVGVACVAVPVRDSRGDVVAAVAVHAATARLPLARAIEFVPQLNVAAQRIGITLN